MAAVVASRSDVPFDTADPLFRFGHGLSYAMPEAPAHPSSRYPRK
jgi:beta-glucosidase